MNRAIGRVLAALTAVATVAAIAPRPADAQLRPYEPLVWEIFDADRQVAGRAGVRILADQRASLAGSVGRLVEVGVFQAALRTGRVAFEAAGTPYRFLREDGAFAEPYGGARPAPLGTRHGVGDFIVATSVVLTPPGRPAIATLRFGTRLPTTDNLVGLERDQIDFFALAGGRLDHGPLRATAEAGVGIHGTRELVFEQSDVLVLLFGAELRHVPLRPAVLLTGHRDGLAGWTVRGNEDLAEIRLRIRSAGRVRLLAEVVRGLTEFSPSTGVGLSIEVVR